MPEDHSLANCQVPGVPRKLQASLGQSRNTQGGQTRREAVSRPTLSGWLYVADWEYGLSDLMLCIFASIVTVRTLPY